jgi:hypothetical protein
VDNGQGLAVDVHSSQTYQADPSQPGEYTLAQNITANSWDQWNSDRDSALARLEANESTARASSGNPDNPAWNDLDYYGSWYDLPGYGQVWSPSGVGAGWDPFANGAWGYYPSWGYTWISGYPWGWWPYHCGAWDFLDGYGWIWIPGNCGWGLYGGGWFPYSTVWSVPHGYVLPPRPHTPIRGGPRHPIRLVAVDRGEEYSAPFHFDKSSKPAPRALTFEGRTIAPLEAGIHPLERGPLGESFTTALVRVHPEMAPPALRTPGAAGAFHGAFAPQVGVRTFGAPPGFGTSHLAGQVNGGRGGSNAGGGSRGSFSSGGGGGHVSGGFSGGASAGGGHVGGAAPASSGGSAHH